MLNIDLITAHLKAMRRGHRPLSYQMGHVPGHDSASHAEFSIPSATPKPNLPI